MKRICKIFAVLLVITIAMFSFSITAGATEVSNSQDGLVASITSEKESYKANEDIELTFKVTNTNDFAVENVSLEAIIPDGLTLKNNADTNVNTVSLGSGESLELTLIAVKESSVITVPIGDCTEPSTENPTQAQPVATEATENTTVQTATTAVVQTESIQATTTKVNSAISDTSNVNNSDNTPIKTGNSMSYLLAVLICLVCLAVVIISFRFRKKAVKYLSLVLCICIAFGSFAVVGVTNTRAQETKQQMSFGVSKNITVENKNYEIKSTIKYIEPIGKQNDEFIPSRDADSYVDDDFYNTSPDKSHKAIDKDTGIPFINNEIEICVKDGTSDNEIETLCSKYKAQIVSKIKSLNSYKVRFRESYTYSELQEIKNNLNKEDCIDESSLVLVMHTQTHQYYPTSKNDRWSNDWNAIPSGANWGIEAIKAPQSWEYIDLMKKVNVGVYDQGFDTNHEDLKNVINTASLYPANPKDHGTHVTGIIGAEFENGIGINGVCPTAKFSLYNYDENDTNNSFTFKYAMDYLIEQNNSKVINMSLGQSSEILFAASMGEFSAQEYLKSLSAYCEETLKRLLNENLDFVICTSAGNNRGYSYYKSDDATYGYYMADPKISGNYLDNNGESKKWNGKSSISGSNQSMADWDDLSLINDEEIKNRIIVVGAIQNESNTTEKYSLCSFSDIGKSVDVVAPGYDIESTVSNNGYEWQYVNENGTTSSWAGTSMASPHVAGIAAMLYSLDPDLTGDEVKRIICDTATTNVDGYKLVNAEAAVKKVMGQGSLSGKVVSSNNNTGLSNVRVDAYLKLKSGTKYAGDTFTDDKGNYSMELQGGSYELRFNKDGYKTTVQTIKISNDVMTVLKDPIVMENEDTRIIKNGDILTFSGTLKSEYYEINTNNKGTVTILDLDNPIKCYLNDGINYDGKTVFNIDSVQINASDFKKYLGQHVTVKGEVMLAHTGHHRRDIVLMNSIVVN